MMAWSKKKRGRIGVGFRQYLEKYVSDNGGRLLEAARGLLATPEGGTAEKFGRDEEELLSDYQFEKALEDAERPISSRLGRSQRRLSSRFMGHLERGLKIMPLEARLAARLAAGWHRTSDDRVWLLHRDGACRSLAEKPKVLELAKQLGFVGDPFWSASQGDDED